MNEGPRAALVVLSRDDEVRGTVTAELERRYGRDYRIVPSAGSAHGTIR